MKILRGLHALYALLVFSVLFIIFYPLLMIPVVIPSFHRMIGRLNRWWAQLFFHLIFIPYELDYREKLDRKKQYIFCPNHFSYLDIPTMGLNKINTIFVGKSDMEKIPLFGFMYRKLHITVNRESLRSKYQTLIRSCDAIDEGKNLCIFPEGGIITTNPPTMSRFKDGAFRTAIEKQIPIIPVTIPFNWIILPDSTWLPKRKKITVVFHPPIETTGKTLDDLKELKDQTYQIIDQELKSQLQ